MAHYAAYLVETVAREDMGKAPNREVKREREGDVEREYLDVSESLPVIPFGPYQKWWNLYKVCKSGILASNALPDHPQMPRRWS